MLVASSTPAVGVKMPVQVRPPSPLLIADSEPLSISTSAALSKSATGSLKVIVTSLVSPIRSAVRDSVTVAVGALVSIRAASAAKVCTWSAPMPAMSDSSFCARPGVSTAGSSPSARNSSRLMACPPEVAWATTLATMSASACSSPTLSTPAAVWMSTTSPSRPISAALSTPVTPRVAYCAALGFASSSSRPSAAASTAW